MTPNDPRTFDEFLKSVDRDGAIAETRTLAGASLSRRRLLVLAIAGAGTALGPGIGRARAAAALAPSDVSILNYALVLEYLQASFYTEAERAGALTGATAEAARVVGATERAHVTAFRELLGSKAVERPLFDFQGTTEQPEPFLKTAVAFEDLAVAAYKGQARRIRSRAVLTSALGIHTVEARHAAWMRYLNGNTPAVAAFDLPRTRSEIDGIVRSTGFITPRPRGTSERKPRFTG
jgi:hypothetical protein